MGEFLQSVYDDFKSRIESPLAFSIFLSWIFWNSEFVWFLLIGESHRKYHQIIGWQFSILEFWILPLITAPIFILLMPAANNLLMLYRYRLLSLFQDKVQDSKGRYTDALQLVLLQKKTAELEQKKQELNERESAFVQEKLKLENDKEALEREFKEIALIRDNNDKSLREVERWPKIIDTLNSKISRLENSKRGDAIEDGEGILNLGSFARIYTDEILNGKIISSSSYSGYFDEFLIKNNSSPKRFDFFHSLIGSQPGDSKTLDEVDEDNKKIVKINVKLVGIGRNMQVS